MYYNLSYSKLLQHQLNVCCFSSVFAFPKCAVFAEIVAVVTVIDFKTRNSIALQKMLILATSTVDIYCMWVKGGKRLIRTNKLNKICGRMDDCARFYYYLDICRSEVIKIFVVSSELAVLADFYTVVTNYFVWVTLYILFICPAVGRRWCYE